RDIVRIGRAWTLGIVGGRPLADLDARLGWMMIAGTIPIVVCGLAFKDAIETTLRSLYVVATALIVLAIVLAAAEIFMRWRIAAGRGRRLWDETPGRDALVVGAARPPALIPGSPRSGATTPAGLFGGLSRETAARFSFLLSLPSVLAAGLYQL